MDTRYSTVLDEIESLVVLLNNLVRDTGDIPRDHKPLWDNYLHKWSHQDLLRIVEIMHLIKTQDPSLFDLQQDGHLDVIIERLHEGLELNKKEQLLGKRPTLNILDRQPKTDYWKFVMHIREIWNKVHGEPLPLWAKPKRKKKSKPHKMDKTTVYTSDLFN